MLADKVNRSMEARAAHQSRQPTMVQSFRQQLEEDIIPFSAIMPGGSDIGWTLVRQVMHCRKGSEAMQRQAGDDVFALSGRVHV